jgi:DNA polymerase-3 subunit alpha
MNFAYENGSDALAITDHGNMNAMSYQVEHYKKMKAEGKNFKAVYGIEAYFLPSLRDWREEYEEQRDKKKKKKKKDFSLSVEDESESKNTKDLLKRRSHLILLAQNQVGLNNLFQLVSKSYESENFYRYPRMDYEMLSSHSEGIICASACLGGVFASDYWNKRKEGDEAVMTAMRITAQKFVSIFGDKFYGEPLERS